MALQLHITDASQAAAKVSCLPDATKPRLTVYRRTAANEARLQLILAVGKIIRENTDQFVQQERYGILAPAVREYEAALEMIEAD